MLMNEQDIRRLENRVAKRFNRACADFQLLTDGDRVLAALSGGKDSLLMLRLLARRARLYRPRILVEAAHVIMDNIPYETDRTYLSSFCKQEGVRLHLLHAAFDASTDRRKTRCFLCSWYRRKRLFGFAQEQGFTKVALGHHQDDILTTLLMNLTYEGAFDTMPPRLAMQHYALTLIRPLCLVHEDEIRCLAREYGFVGQKVACPYEEVTRRSDVNGVFHQLENLNPETRYSMWRALEKSHPAFCRCSGEGAEMPED